jgi:Zn finger protein HypA/HybF involved in hydrogenase expression
MPVKPLPQRIECRHCGWHTVFAPDSDVLSESPPRICEKCGSTDLTWSPAPGLRNAVLSVLASLVKNR